MNEIHKILLERFKRWPKSPYHFTICSKVSFPDLSVKTSVTNMMLVNGCLPNGRVCIGAHTQLSDLGKFLDMLEKEANCG